MFKITSSLLKIANGRMHGDETRYTCIPMTLKCLYTATTNSLRQLYLKFTSFLEHANVSRYVDETWYTCVPHNLSDTNLDYKQPQARFFETTS